MPGKQYEVYVQKGKPWYTILSGVLFSNAGLFCLVISYACLGAYLFILIELPNEEIQRQTKLSKNLDVEDAIKYLKNIFWIYATNTDRFNFTAVQYQTMVKGDLDTLKQFVVSYNDQYDYDTTEDWEYRWTFAKALLFTVTIITTIGYGHIAPQTIPGQMFCIGYALVGIPLLLVFMANVGDQMAIAFRWIYSRICCRWCRVRRRDNEMLGEKMRDSIRRDPVGKEIYMPTDMVNVPIMVCLLLIIAFLFIGAIAFSSWEDNWSLGAAFYFCFISLTTIGFGDLVPYNSINNWSSGFGSFLKMIFTMVYIVFGIAILSMCIQLMQEEIIGKIEWLVASIGMGKKSGAEEYVKVTKVEKMNQTPADMTGNELDFNEKRRKKNQKVREDPEKVEAFFEEENDDDSDF